MSLVSELILNADSEARYPSPREVRAFQDFCKSGDQRVRIASSLAENEQRIVQSTFARFWERMPVTPSNSGNPRKTASCQRDTGWYIRLIAYCVLAGSEKPLEEVGTIGIKEMYNSLGIPIQNIAECFRCAKQETLATLSGDDASEVGPYWDLLIASLS